MQGFDDNNPKLRKMMEKINFDPEILKEKTGKKTLKNQLNEYYMDSSYEDSFTSSSDSCIEDKIH